MNIPWDFLSSVAWAARDKALMMPDGKTKVGAAAMSEEGVVRGGCNLQHKYRCDIHAEVAAIASLRTASTSPLIVILIAAERKEFTPCGACMDWILEVGGGDCLIAFQASPTGLRKIWCAHELMPHYPS